ncbi:MAG: hypothetical protein K8U57_05510 [Planctomycetes bacterium]|nr:hypothetical protein [Planctomycetota bacterium]
MFNLKRFSGVLAAVLMTAGIAHASGAGFTLSAVGATLGKVEDENAEIPKYRVKLEVGQTLTLAAQGQVIPRGQPAQPGEPDAAAWLFDDTAFTLEPLEKGKADKTKSVIALKAAKAGQTRVRFVGNILGYERKFDVMVEVVAAKK